MTSATTVKKFLALIFLASVVLFSGCTQNADGEDVKLGNGWNWPGQNSNAEEGQPSASDIYSGTRGLVMEFVEDATPDSIFQSNGLVLLMELWNKGAYPVDGRLYLSGYDKNLMTMDQTRVPVSLEGKSRFNLEGGYSTVSFASTSISLPEGSDTYTPNFVVTGCYDYQTVATPIVCIDPNPQKTTQAQSCTPRSVSLGGGQGAPIAVTNVDVEALPEKTRFKITVQNVGNGDVVNANKCPYDLSYLDLNSIQYDISLSNIPSAQCQPKSPIRLINGEATIYCIFDVEGKDAYQAPLSIKLDYGYMTTTQKEVNIKYLY
jgi:hypothetical protein